MKLFAAVVVAVLACANAESPLFFQEELVDHVNSLKTTWVAGINRRFQGVPLDVIKNQMGVLEGGEVLPVKDDIAEDIPDSFDARTVWPACPSIGEVRDQGSCGSCWVSDLKWVLSSANLIHCACFIFIYFIYLFHLFIYLQAFGAVEAMTDRYCIHFNQTAHISAEDLNSCCKSCGNG